MRVSRYALVGLGLVAGASAIVTVAMFLLMGGPGILYGFAWIWLHPELVWREGGAEHATLREIAMPANVPRPTERTWDWYRPDGPGPQSGRPVTALITERPGRAEWVGVYSGSPPGPATDVGVVLDAERRRVGEFRLQGGSPPFATSIVMPNANTLLVAGSDRTAEGRYVRTLDEYDFERKTRTRRLTGQMFGYDVWFTRLDQTTAVVAWGTGELPMGMNMQRPEYVNFRVYAAKAPRGVDLFGMSYRIGSIHALWTERLNEVTFVTRFDHGFTPQRKADRAWSLTLRSLRRNV